MALGPPFRLALLAFRDIYNATWLIRRLNYQTPPRSGSNSFQPPRSPRRLPRDVSSTGGGTTPPYLTYFGERMRVGAPRPSGTPVRTRRGGSRPETTAISRGISNTS
jgi:hypothetical protein